MGKIIVTSGSFMERTTKPSKQINRMEFEENIIRLGTGELDPRIFPRISGIRYWKIWHHRSSRLDISVRWACRNCRKLWHGTWRAVAYIRHLPIFNYIRSVTGITVDIGSALKPGSTVYTEAPSYMKSLQVFQSQGMRLSGVPMDEYGIQLIGNLQN